jgi:hypothetical protein
MVPSDRLLGFAAAAFVLIIIPVVEYTKAAQLMPAGTG